MAPKGQGKKRSALSDVVTVSLVGVKIKHFTASLLTLV